MKERLGLRGKHKSHADDLTGHDIGPLHVLGEAEKTSGSRNTRWECECSLCGKHFSVSDYWLTHSDPYGHCQCTKYAKTKGDGNPSFKHGGCRTILYNRWNAMLTRTSNPNADNYKYYGGRGITVCEAWKDFSVFQDWCISNGWDETKSVDRINNDLGYSPDNCRVIPLCEQNANRRPFNPHKSSST